MTGRQGQVVGCSGCKLWDRLQRVSASRQLKCGRSRTPFRLAGTLSHKLNRLQKNSKLDCHFMQSTSKSESHGNRADSALYISTQENLGSGEEVTLEACLVDPWGYP